MIRMAIKETLCHVIKGDSLLLKRATRGISKGKWNGPGGKFNPGETPAQCAVRETLEETGLRMIDPFLHGKMYFYMNGSRRLDIDGYLFSARKFSGRLKSTEEGEVRWFKRQDLPFNEMWDDDKTWIDLMLEGRRFNSYFYYGRGNARLKECRIVLI